ncbi:MAG: signal peptide protein [Verrucomicrobia bacterium]|jgi:outer membrane protein assembly factor BamB|nr:signal peptide protein [Verrucomicrobiota bacterium]
MKRTILPLYLGIGLLTLATGALFAADKAEIEQNWHQWRGPKADGVAPKATPPTEWSETKNVKWKVKTPGFGTSTPIIWGNKVFLLTAIKAESKTVSFAVPSPVPAGQVAQPKGPGPGGPPPGGKRGKGGGGFGGGEKPTDKYQFVVLCLDRTNGKTIWQKTVREEVPHEGHHRDHGFASASPMTDGKHLYVSFGSRGIYCLDLDGNVKWEVDLGNMTTRNGFGEGSSPSVYGDVLIQTWDQEANSFVVALNATTGKELWRKPREEATSWATPLIVEVNGKPQAIINATTKVRSYDLKTGEIVWESSGQTVNVIPSPVTGNGMVYIMSGFRGSALHAIKLGKTGNVMGTDGIVWSFDRGTPYVPSPLLYGDKLYFHKGNDAFISCLDALKGTQHYVEQRLTGPSGIYASPIGAADKVYVIGRNGTSLVLKNSDKLEVLATNKLDEPIDASPAAVGKELFLRGHQSLYCIAEK